MALYPTASMIDYVDKKFGGELTKGNVHNLNEVCLILYFDPNDLLIVYSLFENKSHTICADLYNQDKLHTLR